MAGEVLVDALPYIDLGYDDPGVREAVSAEMNGIIRGDMTEVFVLPWQCSQFYVVLVFVIH